MSIVWGVQNTSNLDPSYWSYLPALEQKLGRPFAGARRNGTATDDLTALAKSYDHGARWGYMNGKVYTQTPGIWADTAAGKYDAGYTALFQRIAASGRWTTTNPLHFSFHHEQYVTAENGGPTGGTAAEYIAAFRHVRALLAPYHVSDGGPLVMCFTPHWLQFYHDPIVGDGKPSPAVKPYVVSKLDPGPAYYDLLGADIYCYQGQSYKAGAQWTPVHKWAVRQGKRFFTGETGIGGSDAKIATYLHDLDALLKAWGTCEAVCWTSRTVIDPGTSTPDDLRLDATPSRLAAYKALAQDAYYGASV